MLVTLKISEVAQWLKKKLSVAAIKKTG